MYTNKFGIQDESTGENGGKKKSKGGVLEGVKLFVEHNYVKVRQSGPPYDVVRAHAGKPTTHAFHACMPHTLSLSSNVK